MILEQVALTCRAPRKIWLVTQMQKERWTSCVLTFLCAERASGCAVAQGGPIVKPGWHRFELTFLLLNKISLL